MSKVNLPLKLTITVLMGEKRVDRAWVAITLPMKTKNPYRLLFGPATSDGSLVVTRGDLLREINKTREFFLMDYADPSVAWTGVLEVRAIGRSDIANLMVAYDTYRVSGLYPSDLSQRLAEYDLALEDHAGDLLTVEVATEGGDGVRVTPIRQLSD